jgi:hypothetical protein
MNLNMKEKTNIICSISYIGLSRNQSRFNVDVTSNPILGKRLLANNISTNIKLKRPLSNIIYCRQIYQAWSNWWSSLLTVLKLCQETKCETLYEDKCETVYETQYENQCSTVQEWGAVDFINFSHVYLSQIFAYLR